MWAVPPRSADSQILSRLQKQRGPRYYGQLPAQAVDHVVGCNPRARLPEMTVLTRDAFRQRFQHDEEAALIRGRVASGKTYHGTYCRIFGHNTDVVFHFVAHRLERDILRRLY